MGLLFNNDDIECPKCSSHLFKEEEVFGLIPKKGLDEKIYYEKVQPEYLIKCALCGKIIKNTYYKSIIKKIGE